MLVGAGISVGAMKCRQARIAVPSLRFGALFILIEGPVHIARGTSLRYGNSFRSFGGSSFPTVCRPSAS